VVRAIRLVPKAFLLTNIKCNNVNYKPPFPPAPLVVEQCSIYVFQFTNVEMVAKLPDTPDLKKP